MSKAEEKKQQLPPKPSASSTNDDNDEMQIDETAAVDPAAEVVQHQLLALADDLFLVASAESPLNSAERDITLRSIETRLRKGEMSGFIEFLLKKRADASNEVAYKFLTEYNFAITPVQLAEFEKSNAAAVKAADEKITEAESIAGDTEVRDAMLARANLYVEWGSTTKGLAELDLTLAKTIGVASKIDVLLTKLRLSLAFIDTRKAQTDEYMKLYKADLDKAKVLIEDGGDWERKNALSVYEAVYLMLTRQFNAASKLLLNAVATFTSLELFTYRTFVFHTCLLALITVDRETLYKELLKSPEILSVLDELPDVRRLLLSLYECRYGEFFSALNDIIPSIRASRYLAPHLSYYLRELRCLGYTQFLSSYASVDLLTMSQIFGVSKTFLDKELFTFISSGRIHAKMNAVSNRIDMEREKEKHKEYTQFIRESDHILNRMQKLMKVCAI